MKDNRAINISTIHFAEMAEVTDRFSKAKLKLEYAIEYKFMHNVYNADL
jgi:hypothetical protein